MATFKAKFEKDYENYLKLCKKYNEEPRKEWEDFYAHRNWLLKNKK